MARATLQSKTLAGLPHSYEVDALAIETVQIGLKVLLANGAEVVSRSGKLVLLTPVEDPVAPPNLEHVKWKGANLGSLLTAATRPQAPRP